jgi:hypothetical protein
LFVILEEDHKTIIDIAKYSCIEYLIYEKDDEAKIGYIGVLLKEEKTDILFYTTKNKFSIIHKFYKYNSNENFKGVYLLEEIKKYMNFNSKKAILKIENIPKQDNLVFYLIWNKFYTEETINNIHEQVSYHLYYYEDKKVLFMEKVENEEYFLIITEQAIYLFEIQWYIKEIELRCRVEMSQVKSYDNYKNYFLIKFNRNFLFFTVDKGKEDLERILKDLGVRMEGKSHIRTYLYLDKFVEKNKNLDEEEVNIMYYLNLLDFNFISKTIYFTNKFIKKRFFLIHL